MISEPAKKLLVAQVATELSAHQTYMGISLYFARQSLNGWAKFFHEQALEEAQHGWKIINFLVDTRDDRRRRRGPPSSRFRRPSP